MREQTVKRMSEVLDIAAKRILEDEDKIGIRFPYVTAPDGSWETLSPSLSAGYRDTGWDHGNWFCGFWVGVLAACYLWTEKP